MLRSLLSAFRIDLAIARLFNQIWEVVPAPPVESKQVASDIDRTDSKSKAAKRMIIALAQALARQAAREDDAHERGEGGARSIVQRKL
jgi:hypothetical protein